MNDILLAFLRNNDPKDVAERLTSVQPIEITPEELNQACEALAALHNLNHPDDQWPTSVVAKMKESE